MARTGWGLSNYLSSSTVPITTYPLTIACWAKIGTLGQSQYLAGIYNSSGGDDRNCYNIYVRSSNEVGIQSADSSSWSGALTTTTVSAGVWIHAAGTVTSATARAAYLNGGGKGTNATSRTATGINRIGAGKALGTGTFGPVGSNSVIAELGFWNQALTDAEIASLAAGASPMLVRPSALVAYWPLVGVNSPENNIVANNSLTITGTLPVSPHPRMFDPE